MKHKNFDLVTYYDNGRSCSRPTPSDRYGRINLMDNTCEVIVYSFKFEEILKANGINEPTTVKKRWKEQGLLKTEKDRYDIKVDGIRSIYIILPYTLPVYSLINPDEEGAQ